MTAQVNVGQYIRRLRMRAVGYDAAGNVVGEDEMVVNDPRPPFRVRLAGAAEHAGNGNVDAARERHAPAEMRGRRRRLLRRRGEDRHRDARPYRVTVDAAKFRARFTRASSRARRRIRKRTTSSSSAIARRDEIDVTVQQIPLSVAEGQRAAARGRPHAARRRRVRGRSRRSSPADDQPLHVILLIDYSESMLEELPVVKAAAKQFAQLAAAAAGPHRRGRLQSADVLADRLHERLRTRVAQAVDRVKPIGETHLYDSVIEMLYELQKKPGRQALVVLTDGVDQGSRFKLDHLVHYARYAGVPVYPIVKNKMLSRLMRFGVGDCRRAA